MTPQLVVLLLRLSLGLVLYAFLGTMMVLLWRELKQERSREAILPPAALEFEAPAEGELPAIPLVESNLIGRAPDNSIVLRDDTVSARHARISYAAGQWILEDLGSKNGTRVNDLLLEQPLVVTYGDRLSFGSIHARFTSGRDAEPRHTAQDMPPEGS